MNSAQGRILFFDALAHCLQRSYMGTLPAWVALRLEGQASLPYEDQASLCQAVCRLQDGKLGLIPLVKYSTSGKIEAEDMQAIVVDAQKHSLLEAASALKGLPRAPRIVTFMNFSHSPESGPVSIVPLNLVEQPLIVRQATERLFSEARRPPPELLAVYRFNSGSGFRAFDDFAIFDETPADNWSNPRVLEESSYAISESWRYRNEPVAHRASQWLAQFAKAGFAQEAICLLRYLRREGFVTELQVSSNIRGQYHAYCEETGHKPLAVTLQPPGKSEPRLAYWLPQLKFLNLAAALDIIRTSGSAMTHLICLDDFVGSGGTVQKTLFNNPDGKTISECFKQRQATLTVLASHADEIGINTVMNDQRAHGAVKVRAAVVIDSTRRVFSAQSRILESVSSARRQEFMNFCADIGRQVYNKAHSLGWHNAQWCIVADYTVPNQTLPIIHQSKVDLWQALFPRPRNMEDLPSE